MDKLVIIPTYNEKENIEKIVRKVFSLSGGFHVLIVDDGSPDGTANIIKGLQKEYADKLFIKERKGKLGLGTAYIAGFKWALEKGYGFIFEMDADFSHDPEDLIRLYDACNNGADLAVGSRYTKGGKVVNWPWDRIFISKGGAMYTKMITWMPVNDPTAGFICYTSKVLSRIPLDKVHFIGYAFQIEMKYRAWKLGFKIKEVPITFKDRKEGVSKMSSGIVKEAMYGVWKMRGFSNDR
ncbi:MAG: dolichyl-phosphate beta-D-mannosyltransferase [Flavipsychrobacter sp.]|nr:dolichyl-phosphate beta-D-mannosyltransferase [Flavipsychrobacter sp.]